MSRQPQSAAVLSVVIPVYNERETWREVVARIEAVELSGMATQIVLVDDCSTDGTRQQLEQFLRAHRDLPASPQAGRIGCKVLFHERNQGKGAALRSGFAAADGQIVIVQDADLEYDPADYPRLVRPILEGRADVVYGSRFRCGWRGRGRLANYLANRLLTALSNFATGLRLTDMETCYKVLRRGVLRRLCLEQDRFGFEPEITARLAGLGVRIEEVAIRYTSRSRAEGKKIGWKDGLDAFWCIVKYALRCRLGLPARR